MINQGFYLATEEVAERAGVKESAYVVKDGRFVLNSQQLKFIRMEPEEYVNGIQGIEKIDYETAQDLIAENGYLHYGEDRKGEAVSEEAEAVEQGAEELPEEADDTQEEPEAEAEAESGQEEEEVTIEEE